MAASSLPHLAQELKDHIANFLPLRSARNYATVLDFQLSQKQISHKIWSGLILEDNEYVPMLVELGLQMFLVGDDLDTVGYHSHKLAYLNLVVHDPLGKINDPKKILNALKSKEVNEDTMEVTFKELNAILNVGGVYHAEREHVVNPLNILSKHTISTRVLIWGDDKIHKISHNRIVGIGHVGKRYFDSVSTICAIELVCNEGKRWSQVFENPFHATEFAPKKTTDYNRKWLHPGWEKADRTPSVLWRNGGAKRK